ncbi:hypothetical protein J7K19_02370 [bacterium]|nr:hypothetical protein [bacterium]
MKVIEKGDRVFVKIQSGEQRVSPLDQRLHRLSGKLEGCKRPQFARRGKDQVTVRN